MKFSKSLFAVSLALAFSGAVAQSQFAHAELVREEVEQDSIVPEAGAADSAVAALQGASSDEEEDEVVVERRIVKKPARAWRKASNPRRVIIQEVQAQEEAAVSVTSSAPVTVVPTPKEDTVGSSIDNAIDAKMNATKQKLADALVKAMDNIKISVGDEAPAQVAAVQAPVVAPTATTVIQDSVVSTVSAPQAENNAYAEIPGDAQKSVMEKEATESDEIRGKIAVFPMAGYSSLNSDRYAIDSRSSVGVGIEVDMVDNFSFVGSFMYSQYDISLALANPYLNYVGTTNSNTQSLEYNQNVIDAGIRYYLLSKNSRFQLYVGAGAAYNKGFLNYRQSTLNTFNTGTSNIAGLQDYEVTSFLGAIETGGDVRLTKSISVGAGFKYYSVLSSRENQQINNNGFLINGSGVTTGNEKNVIGGSISQNSFYSILGNLKVRF